MATIKDIRFVLTELNISKGTSRYTKAQLLAVLNDEFYNNNDLVTSCPLPTQEDVTPIADVTFTFDDGLCLGHLSSIPVALDTYVLHNNAQPIDYDSELTTQAFNEAKEWYPPTPRITNNHLHYICLALAYVYASIYISCQVTHRYIIIVIVKFISAVTRYILAKRLTSIISATLREVTHSHPIST